MVKNNLTPEQKEFAQQIGVGLGSRQRDMV